MFLDSPYRNTLSTAVLKLQEQGKLQAMKIKWWKEKRGGGACSVSIATNLLLKFNLIFDIKQKLNNCLLFKSFSTYVILNTLF